jgi:2-polyprenyl-3-methyl-5-hydroxy-6-metoxy-1,4-benzoquinol methylase
MPSTRTGLNALKSLIRRMISPKVPRHLRRNFRCTDTAGIEEITESLKRHYFTRPTWGESITVETYLSSDEGKRDLSDHLYGRLDSFRQTIIPWLTDAKALSGAHVLEIGCGTGSSTVALAEQGAKVTAVDIDRQSLSVAQDRCRVYGVDVCFFKVNATEVHELFSGQNFDVLIFFACLEHMTHDERIIAMKNTWDMLSRDDLWCVVDSPNRLWYFDGHTSRLPFYLWLPDDLAFKYSRFSPRQPFCKSYSQYTDDAMLSFLRHGRGLSFHEFDLAIKRVEEMDVVSSLPIYLRKLSPLWDLGRRLMRSHNYRYESFLVDVGPKIHRGFYQSSLDLIIRKD